LMRVSDGMHTGADIPRVSPDTPMRDAIMEITKKRLGITTVVDADGQLLGVLSDGDLRRQLESGTSFLDKTAGEVMSAGGKRIAHDALAAEAVTLMERHQITSLVVVDDGRMVGIVHLHDLLKLGLG